MLISNRRIGSDEAPFIIAEIGLTHDGSLGNALAFIDIACDCGVDAVKFQTHIASAESTLREQWRIKFSHQDANRYSYWQRTEFTTDQWGIIKSYAEEKGLIFMSSPFSIEACELLNGLDMEVWKISSGEIFNQEIIDYVASTKKPIIVSTGLSEKQYVKEVVSSLCEKGLDVAVLHCTTKYPTPAEEVAMNILTEYLEELDIPVGLSDHSGEIFPATVACYLGASIVEVHLAMHPKMFGPDVKASLLPEQLSELVKATRFSYKMKQSPVVKGNQLRSLVKEKSIFTRSLVAAGNFNVGHIITEADLKYKKPGGGMEYSQRELLLGKKLVKALEKDEPLSVDYVE